MSTESARIHSAGSDLARGESVPVSSKIGGIASSGIAEATAGIVMGGPIGSVLGGIYGSLIGAQCGLREYMSAVRGISEHIPAPVRLLIPSELREYADSLEIELKQPESARDSPEIVDNTGVVTGATIGDAVSIRTAKMADAAWSMRAKGRRFADPQLRQYDEKHVAVYEQRIVAHGDDYTEVLQRAMAECGVPFHRIIMSHWSNPSTLQTDEGDGNV